VNKDQRKYALERISNITRRKVREAEECLTSLAVYLEAEEMLRLVRDGKVKFREFIDPEAYYLKDVLREVFDFSGYEQKKSVDPALDKEVARIKQQAAQIEDEIMLGDATEALDKINQFDKED
jgi:hypothetical protein